jgi:hypothetical protein
MVRKRGDIWYYDFMIRRIRYRAAIPEARTKSQAEQAEAQARLEVYQGKYGKPEGSSSFVAFVKETYLPWSKLNKRSSYDDGLICKMLCEHFAGKSFAAITPMLVERFKRDRREGLTKYGTQRQPATVNRELAVLSRIFTLAVEQGLVDCSVSF